MSKKKKKESKLNLSDEKLKLEIQNLKKPWHQKLEFWKILIPTIAVLTSLYFTFGKGIVDSQREKLSIQKEQLKLEILQFQIKKGTVIEDVDKIKNELSSKEKKLDSLNKSINYLNIKNSTYKKQLNETKKEIKRVQKERINELNSISIENELDKNFFAKKLFKQYEIVKKKTKQIHDYEIKISRLENESRMQKIENNFYEKKFKLTSKDLLELSLLKTDTLIERRKKTHEKLIENLKKIDQKLKDDIKKIEKDSISLNEALRELDLRMRIKEQETKNKKE